MSVSPTPPTALHPREARIHCLRALPDSVRPEGATRAAITEAMVRLLRARTGRGPTVAKTQMSASLALVSIGDCATATEVTLVREGHEELATQVRTAIYEGMRADAVDAVERITGHSVVAYLTAHRHHPDLAMIAFHLGEPLGPRAA